MSNSSNDQDENQPIRPWRRPLPTGLLSLINATALGVSGVFIATASVPVTVIAAGTTLLLTTLVLTLRR